MACQTSNKTNSPIVEERKKVNIKPADGTVRSDGVRVPDR